MPARKISAVLIACFTLVAAALAAGGPAQAAHHSGRAAIAHSKPAWLAHARHLGAAKSSAAVEGRVYLAPRGGLAALKQAALAVSTPGSATYHHFLTAQQYRAQYAPSASDVSAVRSWLTGAGLHVDKVAPGNRYLSVRGTVRGAEKAFGTQIGRYVHNGATVQAPASSLTVPAALASRVLTITGIDTTPHLTRPKAPKPPDAFVNARPCSRYYGEKPANVKADGTPLPAFNGSVLPYAVCGYTGPQFRGAYEGGTTQDGTGVTVAITDAYASTTMAADASTYAANNGDRAYARGQYREVLAHRFTDAHLCDPAGWSGEQSLDVEAVHAMAQGANIVYYGAASCLDADFLDTLAQVVEDDDAQVVTNSWGDLDSNETADSTAAYEGIFLQGAVQGISFLFSSGDNGDELDNSGIIQTDYPASDPYVTAVGGTSTAIGASNGLSWQTGWGTEKYTLSADSTTWDLVGFLYGAGGGQSAVFPKPAYQAGITPGTTRSVPDVGMDADPTTGMLVGQTQLFPRHSIRYGEYRIGGTSLASPLFAGMTAIALQGSGHGGGLLNPVIYSHAGAFTDVTGPGPDAGNVRVDFANGIDGSGGLLYSVRTFDQDSSLAVTPGWDAVTGLGSPNAAWFNLL